MKRRIVVHCMPSAFNKARDGAMGATVACRQVLSRFAFHDSDLLVGEVVEAVDDPVDEIVGEGNLPLDGGALVASRHERLQVGARVEAGHAGGAELLLRGARV